MADAHNKNPSCNESIIPRSFIAMMHTSVNHMLELFPLVVIGTGFSHFRLCLMTV